MRKNSATVRRRAAPPSPAPRPAPRATVLEVDLGVLDGAGLAEVVVLAGVVIVCAAAVEEADDDDEDEVVDEGDAVEEDDVLLVTLKYCDLIRGPRSRSEELYSASQKRLLRDRSCVGSPSQS